MSSSRTCAPKSGSEEIPPVPLTIEGYSVLHQMMRVRWAAWRQTTGPEKTAMVEEASGVLSKMEQSADGTVRALFSARTQGRSDVRPFSKIV